ncbi:ribonuclease HIII [Sulfuriroseicoccus oceanibius]|uniref:Ribonuclease n=1 Tax=Sulfuriroseicoccus oceanibius TaxID=2707525 RepID=A0A6B3L5N3_9BACT|nr:ribonuclease HIII [Sulfuriroseicoccus oceanibius]QQL45284.1 ribonuclease HIII [Sulfuriroseicoccus oceanibius]
MSGPTSHTEPLTLDQAEKLRGILERKGFTFSAKPYSIYSAAKKSENVNVTVYEKGPKVLIQGKGTREFLEFVLEPEITGKAVIGYEAVHNPEMNAPHFGIDESGKGDFFGPLVVAGVYTDESMAAGLIAAGVQDSKAIKSDRKIRDLAKKIRETPGIAYDVLELRPETYNRLYAKFGNLNQMLAWGHATVIANLHQKRPDCPRALSDQFANPRVLKQALGRQKIAIELEQKTKAESDVAVAAASILARDHFVRWMDRASTDQRVMMPRGAGPKVLTVGRQLVEREGSQILESVAKLHFRTASQLTN